MYAGMTEKLQIRFEFNTAEDRLLLRISVRERENSCVEYRFWLTRRFVNMFIKAIERLIENDLAADMQVSPDTMGPMKKFQQEAALAKADFASSFQGGDENCTLYREKPLLVTILKIKKKSKGKYVLSLLDGKKSGIHLTAGMDLIHSLQKMLFDSAHNADWNQPLLLKKDEGPETVMRAGYVS